MYLWALGILAVAVIGLKNFIIGFIAGVVLFSLAVIALQTWFDYLTRRIDSYRNSPNPA